MEENNVIPEVNNSEAQTQPAAVNVQPATAQQTTVQPDAAMEAKINAAVEERLKKEKPDKPRRGRGGFKIKLVIIIVLIVAALIAGMIFGSKVGTLFGEKKEITSHTIEFKLKDIGELATQVGYFTNVQAISDAKVIFGFEIPFTQSKYVYSYDGEIKAGLNFEHIAVEVNDTNKIVTVKMPPIEILSIEVMEDSLEIYDENRNVFTPLRIADYNESLAKMKEEIRDKAVANGLLEHAEENAEVLIKEFVTNIIDSTEYSFEFIPLTAEELQSMQAEEAAEEEAEAEGNK